MNKITYSEWTPGYKCPAGCNYAAPFGASINHRACCQICGCKTKVTTMRIKYEIEEVEKTRMFGLYKYTESKRTVVGFEVKN